jgi:hypothetical protein
MKLGITGSHKGWNKHQRESFIDFLKSKVVDEFHHGDCIGVDERAAM